MSFPTFPSSSSSRASLPCSPAHLPFLYFPQRLIHNLQDGQTEGLQQQQSYTQFAGWADRRPTTTTVLYTICRMGRQKAYNNNSLIHNLQDGQTEGLQQQSYTQFAGWADRRPTTTTVLYTICRMGRQKAYNNSLIHNLQDGQTEGLQQQQS